MMHPDALPKSSVFKRAAILTALSVLAVAPVLWKRGLDVVTITYSQAALGLWRGESLYQSAVPGGDLFKYSPAFALFYSPWALLAGPLQALCWALLNAFVFWMGIVSWSEFPSKQRKGLWFYWIIVAMELDISLRYQQFNACMTGLTLWALWEASRGQWRKSGIALGIVSQLKLLPLIFPAVLFFRSKPPFRLSFVVSVICLLLLPALVWGWSHNLSEHVAWWQLLSRDAASPGLLDIRSALSREGCPVLGTILRVFVAVVGAVAFVMAWTTRSLAETHWKLGFSLGVCAVTLLSPRTESPTFVFAIPALLFLAETEIRQIGGRSLLVLSAFLTTLSYTDLWPKVLWDPRNTHYLSKPLGVLILWALSVFILCRRNWAVKMKV